MLKRQGHGQITVILAADINPMSVGYMKNNMFSKLREICSSRKKVELITKCHDLCELATYFTDITI